MKINHFISIINVLLAASTCSGVGEGTSVVGTLKLSGHQINQKRKKGEGKNKRGRKTGKKEKKKERKGKKRKIYYLFVNKKQ